VDDADRVALVGGPYAAPQVSRGDRLDDAALGSVIVGGYTNAPIPWPRRMKAGRPSLILCGDLISAVEVESEIAIAHWWGVGVVTVWAWRKALGIGRVTEGTERLYRDLKAEKLPDDLAARGRERAAKPDAKAKMAATKRGRPAPPQTRAALLAAAKAPKSEAWRQQLAERNRARAEAERIDRRSRNLPVSTVTKERAVELYRLGATFQEIARTLDCGMTSVGRWLKECGVTARPDGRRPTVEAKAGSAVATMFAGGIPIPEIRKLADEPVDRDARRRAIVKDLQEGQPHQRIADRHGVTAGTVHMIAHQSGLLRPRMKADEERRAHALVLYRRGVATIEIGDAVGRSTVVVRKWAREAGLPPRPRGKLQRRTER
jgi:transposase